jgi:hypothetical protein
LKKLTIVCVFLCFALGGWAQDLIIYKDGRRISCRVTGIDSANIYCRIPGSRVTGIPLSDVHKYYLSRRSTARLAKGLPPGISRDRENLFLFGGSAASSLPVNDYASMDINSATSGLALRGWAFNGLVMFKLKDYLGAKVTYRSVGHAFKLRPSAPRWALPTPVSPLTARQENGA